MEKVKNNNKLKGSIIIGAILVLLIGISYALFSYLKLGDKSNVVKTGTLVINIDDDMGEAIDIENAYPINDEAGINTDPYRFTVTNNGSVDANYELNIISDIDAINNDGCSKTETLANYIKYQYVKVKDTTSSTSSINFLSTTSNWTKTRLETGSIKAGETIEYELRMWLDEDTEYSEARKHLHAKVEVNAIQYTESIN